MSSMDAAIQAILKGFHIFPVQPGEKTPHRIYPDKPYTIRWSEVATDDPTKVVEWWQYSPEANVGIACKPSGLLVVDCDMPKSINNLRGTPFEFLHETLGGYVDGTDVLKELCVNQFGQDWSELTDTYQVCTTRGGLHLYYRWPEDVEASQASIVRGVLDIRCNGGDKGGYVLGAGSVTPAGRYTVELDRPVAPAPPWLVELCRVKPRPARPTDTFRQPGSANFGGLVEAVRLAPEGNRNNCLLWAARSMCEDGASEEEAMSLLVPAALECGLDGGERQARQTIQSAYRLQRQKTGR